MKKLSSKEARQNVQDILPHLRVMVVLNLREITNEARDLVKKINVTQEQRMSHKSLLRKVVKDILSKKADWIKTTGFDDLAEAIVEKEKVISQKLIDKLVDGTNDLHLFEGVLKLMKHGRRILNHVLTKFDKGETP
jgi:hypothetical protein